MAVGLSASPTLYRPWTGDFHSGAWRTPWPIARVALRMIFRRRLFWFLFALALFNFLFCFFGMYLLSQVKGIEPESKPTGLMFLFGNMRQLATILEEKLFLNGTGETYRRFFWMQGYIVMGVLAMAGSIIIGNDYQHGSLPFYLGKPLTRRHYLLGKLLAVALFLNMTTTLPALAIYVEYAMLDDWSNLVSKADLLWGILAYGAMLSVVLPLLVVALASWLRKTVPLVLVWAGLLIFCRLFSRVLVDRLGFDAQWRLIDIWHSLYILGSRALGVSDIEKRGNGYVPPQPEWWQAALVLTAISAACVWYLHRKIRAVEVVA